jgi:hypothetical protein
MSQRKSGYERKPRDLYETPAWVSSVIVPHIPKDAVVWEPACASGKMASVISAEYLSDLVTPEGDSGVNFLEQTLANYPKTTAIITNPPFNREAERFIRHSLNLMRPVRGFVAMLLPVDFDSARTRSDIFGYCPAFAKKIVLTKRIVWFERDDGTANPSANHAWFVWDFSKRGQVRPGIHYHIELPEHLKRLPEESEDVWKLRVMALGLSRNPQFKKRSKKA